MFDQMDIYDAIDAVEADEAADFREIALGLPARPGVLR